MNHIMGVHRHKQVYLEIEVKAVIRFHSDETDEEKLKDMAREAVISGLPFQITMPELPNDEGCVVYYEASDSDISLVEFEEPDF